MKMKLFEKEEFRILWPFYLEYFISSCLFFMPAFLVVYFSNLGLTAFQMGILLAIWPLSSLIFEIPTGAFADLYGRKASVLLGYFLEALVMLSLFFWKDFKLMLISFTVLGLATTFSSGSKDAWIVDMINKTNRKVIHGFFSKMQFFISVGLIFSGIIGAFLVKIYGLSIIWIAAFSSYILSIILLQIFTRGDYLRKKTNFFGSISNLKKQTKISLSYSRKHHIIFYLILAGMVAAFALNLQSSIAWIPLLEDLGMKEHQFGYLWSVMSLITAISPILALKVLKKGKEKNFIVLGLVFWSIITAGILFAYNLIFALIVMFLGLLFYFAKNPSEEVYFHRFIPSKLRATVGSIRNMVFSLAVIIILPIEGWLVDNIGPRYTILISVLLMIPAIIIYSKIRENNDSAPGST